MPPLFLKTMSYIGYPTMQLYLIIFIIIAYDKDSLL